MRNLLDGIIQNSNLGFWPAIGTLILMGSMLAIMWKIFVRGNVVEYQKLASMCTDGEQRNEQR
jgi:hypothetical protein